MYIITGKGTANAVYIVRTVMERSTQKYIKTLTCALLTTQLTFSYCEKSRITKMPDTINIGGEDLRIIKNMYWKQTAAVRVDNQNWTVPRIQRDVRQGVCISPDLF